MSGETFWETFMQPNVQWYWVSSDEGFKGFITEQPKYLLSSEYWAGPFRTFSEAKENALSYFRQKARTIHGITSDIKAERKP